MNSWKSNAKYGQKPEEGSVFELKNDNLQIAIHHYVGCGSTWYLSCQELNVCQYCLDTENFEVAVERAKNYLKKVLQSVEENFYNFKESFYNFYNEEGNERVRH